MPDTGERIARLEVQDAHLNEKLDKISADLATVTKAVTEIKNTFEQAKGAKYVIIGAAAIGGFLSAKLGWLVPSLFGKVP